jgi:transcriptional regulator with XRE-family HTH domain
MNTKAERPATVGKRIEQARTAHGMSQAQLGVRLEVTRAAVSQYEKDKIAPRAQVLARLVQVFKAAPEWFTEGLGAEPPPPDVQVSIPEIDPGRITWQFDDPRKAKTHRWWSVPSDAFDGRITPDHMIAFAAPNAVAPINVGDRVIVDLSRKTGPGVLLIYVVDEGARLYRREDRQHKPEILGRVVAVFRAL